MKSLYRGGFAKSLEGFRNIPKVFMEPLYRGYFAHIEGDLYTHTYTYMHILILSTDLRDSQ